MAQRSKNISLSSVDPVSARESVRAEIEKIRKLRIGRDDIETQLRMSIENAKVALESTAVSEKPFLKRLLQEAIASAPSVERGSATYGQVISLLGNNPKTEWTVSEVVTALSEDCDAPADSKTVNDILNYLEKSGRLVRIKRGHYFVCGWGLRIMTDDATDRTYLDAKGKSETKT